MKQITMLVIGAGSRGTRYSEVAASRKDMFKVVAVAEPIEARRNHIKELFDIPEDMCKPSWEEFLERPRFADVAVIGTMDRDHLDLTLKAIEKGYDILLEKPMSATAEECCQIQRAAEKKGVFVLVCHVLRFTPFFLTLKNLINEDKIGQIMHIQHAECVGNVHQSHSFVRGNWRNSKESSPMILQKSCHDMDILAWLMGERCTKVSSFGSLTFFRPENAPEGAPMRCTDGCPHADTCLYYAPRIYLEKGRDTFMTHALLKRNEHGTDEEIVELLKTEPFGRCVFHCDNDVVDHQAVNLEFESGATVSFTMCAFNKGGRHIRIMGTKGELLGNMDEDHITYFDFKTRKHIQLPIENAVTKDSIDGGHGGGDTGIMMSLSRRLNGDMTDISICSLADTCRNHLISFAAEESRVTGKVVDMKEFEESFGGLVD